LPVLAALRPLWDVDTSGWFAYGPDGRLAYVNRSFQRLTESRPDIGTTQLVPVVASERRAALRRAFDRLLAGESSASTSVVPVLVNGLTRPLHLSLTAVEDRPRGGNHVVGVVSPVVRAAGEPADPSRSELLEHVLDRVMHAVSAVLPEDDETEPLDSDDLSARQRQVLRLLLRGERPSAVAASLHLSTHTVRNYEKAIFRTFGVHSQADLIALSRAMRRHPAALARTVDPRPDGHPG
jgi:DNA-binding CsgD family transcriptional regulator